MRLLVGIVLLNGYELSVVLTNAHKLFCFLEFISVNHGQRGIIFWKTEDIE